VIAALTTPHLTVAAHLANFIRLAVMFAGGGVIGSGAVILAARARFYKTLQMPTAVRAMYVLTAMNTLVLAYVVMVLVDRWDAAAIGWPTLGAGVIFAVKAWFFYLLRDFGLAQERDLMLGDSAWLPDRQ
jgi:hypothetical protein